MGKREWKKKKYSICGRKRNKLHNTEKCGEWKKRHRRRRV